MREQSDIDRHSRWQDVKKKIDSDPRYKCVDSSTLREDWFREHLKVLKEERKREKDRDRKDRDRKDRNSVDNVKEKESKEPETDVSNFNETKCF